jgi:hypothetical protein
MVADQKKIHVYTYSKTFQNKENTHAGRKTFCSFILGTESRKFHSLSLMDINKFTFQESRKNLNFCQILL